MNCIFICAFFRQDYLIMLRLLLESIFLYSNIIYTNDLEILIYTNKSFAENIKYNFSKYLKYIKFVLNNFENTSESCFARLDLFRFNITNNYEKVLYLDTDIIIRGDLTEIFEIAQDEIIYAMQEGTIDSDTNYWGKYLFNKSDLENITDKSGFSSGILLFKNCSTIQKLFQDIKKDAYSRRNVYYDQPFIVFHAIKNNLYNNKELNKYAINVEKNCELQNYTICHFYGGLSVSHVKISKMKKFLNLLKCNNNFNETNSIYEKKNIKEI